jgi:hypothetical protein
MKCTWALVPGFALAISLSATGQQFSNFLDGSTLPGSAGWTVDGDQGTLVDLGGGNFGIQQSDDNPGGGGGVHTLSYDEYYMTVFDVANTLAARFRLDQYSGSTPRLTLLGLTPGTPGGNNAPGIGIGVRNVNGVDRWVAMRFLPEAVINPPPAELTLADLGPVVLGQFNEALIHIDNATDLVRISWNGAEVYNAVTPADYTSGGEGYPEFGASNYWGEGGTSTVTYDWVGYGPGYVPEPGAAALGLLGGTILLARRRHGGGGRKT